MVAAVELGSDPQRVLRGPVHDAMQRGTTYDRATCVELSEQILDRGAARFVVRAIGDHQVLVGHLFLALMSLAVRQLLVD